MRSLGTSAPLQERQQVTVTVEETSGDPADAWLDHEYHAAVDAMPGPEPTREEVRGALSTIKGTLSEAVRAERGAPGLSMGRAS